MLELNNEDMFKWELTIALSTQGQNSCLEKKIAMWGLKIGAMHNLSTFELKDAISIEYNNEITSLGNLGISLFME